ncbi:MAG: phosphatase PAP2 family protein [Lachnospiraceae bacterium]|nr:phosphatase PAP2 family protein [Lachnospiraceae bacterium]
MDADILLFIQEYIRNPALDVFFKAITHLGDAGIFWIILTICLLPFKKTRKAGICSACALLGSLLVNNMILKVLVNRTRPYEMIEGLVCIIAPAVDASFPSGHTGASFASAVAMFWHLPRRWGILLLVIASLIAFSRLYVGVHYPTDVLGGLVTGIGLGLLVNFVGERISRRKGTATI